MKACIVLVLLFLLSCFNSPSTIEETASNEMRDVAAQLGTFPQDSLTYVFSRIDSLDTIKSLAGTLSLPLTYRIITSPSNYEEYVWIQVGNETSMRFETVGNVFFQRKSLECYLYDPLADTLVDVSNAEK